MPTPDSSIASTGKRASCAPAWASSGQFILHAAALPGDPYDAPIFWTVIEAMAAHPED